MLRIPRRLYSYVHTESIRPCQKKKKKIQELNHILLRYGCNTHNRPSRSLHKISRFYVHLVLQTIIIMRTFFRV